MDIGTFAVVGIAVALCFVGLAVGYCLFKKKKLTEQQETELAWRRRSSVPQQMQQVPPPAYNIGDTQFADTTIVISDRHVTRVI